MGNIASPTTLKDAVNESYFLGGERKGQVREYFTYFSEFRRRRDLLAGVEATVIAILFLTALIGNSIVLLKLVRKNRIQKFTNCFLANLAFADNLFVLTAPLIAVTRVSQSWILGNFLCHLMMYLMFVCGAVAIWTMAAISVERYQLIVKQKTRPLGKHSAVFIIVILWLVACSAFVPMGLYFDLRSFLHKDRQVLICTLVWPDKAFRGSIGFSFTVCIFAFLIPLGLMWFNYFQIFKTFWQSRRAVRPTNVDTSLLREMNRSESNAAICRRMRTERDFRLARLLFLLVALFVAMWSPVFICLMGIQFDGHTKKMHSEYILASTCLAYGNICMNPFIYGLINRGLCTSCFRCPKCFSGQRNSNEEQPIFTITNRHRRRVNTS